MSMAQSKPMIPVENHPGIYSRGTRYVVVYRVRGAQRKRAFRTLTEARRFKTKADTGEAVSSARKAFLPYAEGWLATYNGRTSGGLRKSTRDSYADAIGRVIVPYFRKTAPSLKLDEVMPSMLRGFIAELASQGKAPATVRRYYAPLRAMLATAYEDDLIVRNPASGVRVIVEDKRPRRRKRLTPEETRRLLAEIPADHADLTYLMAATGLRISEAFALVWSDFAASDDGPTLTVRESKTDAGRRTIPLSPDTGRRLTKRQTTEGGRKSDPIFANARGRMLDACNYRREVFNPASDRAEVPWATPHCLRHGMASLMADHGYTAAQIASHLGHADGGVLAQRTYIKPAMIEAPVFVDNAFASPK
jgi:integrase